MVSQPLIQKNLAFTKDISRLAKVKSKMCDDKMRRIALSQINQNFYIQVAIIFSKLVTLRGKALIPKEYPLLQKYLWKLSFKTLRTSFAAHENWKALYWSS